MLNEKDLRLFETHKLQKLLFENDIHYENEAWISGEHICIPSIQAWKEDKDEKRISIICCAGSYGYESGLLGMWAPGVWEDVIGDLTAEEAFDKIKEVLNGSREEQAL